VVGRDAGQARALLEQQGFEVKVDREEALAPLDRVVRQEPTAGSDAAKGSTITVVASSGPPDRVIPSVERLPFQTAVQRLQKAGFKVDVDTEPSDTVKKGLATRTAPDGGSVAEQGSRVRLFVSAGPEKAKVPDLIGLDRRAAERAIEDRELVPVVSEQESDRPVDTVIAQFPAPGTGLAKGERVTITISKGLQSAKVPDVVGLAPSDARGQLRQEGFAVDVRERAVTDESDDGIVVDQRPAPGTQLKKGRTVVIYVGKFTPAPEPAPDQTPDVTPLPGE
jgi:serine/threonine-protein kinase